MKRSYVYAALFVLGGLLLLLAGLYARNFICDEHGFLAALCSLAEAAGATLFGVGVLSITIELKEWRDYFEDRLRGVVVNRSYLQTLDAETLTSLQNDTFKAKFKDQTLDREGGFLRYFHQNLHQYIGEPYRENVSSEVEYSEQDRDTWRVVDSVSYVCRQAGGRIQSAIRWQPEPGEFVEVQKIEVRVKYPSGHPKMGTTEMLHSTTSGDNSHPNPQQQGVSKSLEGFLDVDGLIVQIDTTYIVKKERFQTWTMTQPTKNFDITVIFPPNCDIIDEPLVIHPELVIKSRASGHMKIKYDSWMLPHSGVAWRIVERDPNHTGDQAVPAS